MGPDVNSSKPQNPIGIKILQWINLIIGSLLLYFLITKVLFSKNPTLPIDSLTNLPLSLLASTPFLIFLLTGFSLLIRKRSLFKLTLRLSVVFAIWYLILGLLLLPYFLQLIQCWSETPNDGVDYIMPGVSLCASFLYSSGQLVIPFLMLAIVLLLGLNSINTVVLLKGLRKG